MINKYLETGKIVGTHGVKGMVRVQPWCDSPEFLKGFKKFFLDKNGESHFCEALKGEVINSVGAGDSMLAGFLAGIERGENSDYALKLGTASGGATAFSSDLAKKEMIEKLFSKLC